MSRQEQIATDASRPIYPLPSPELANALTAFGLQEYAKDGYRAPHAATVALLLWGDGYCVFPAFEQTKTPSVGFKNLKPHNTWQMASRLKSFPDANWLMRTGKGTGVDVLIDVDGYEGENECIGLEHEHGKLPKTWTVESGRVGGGRHLLYRVPPGCEVEFRNQQHMFGLHIDIRGWRGYAVIAGSIHPATGARYRWRDGCAPGECELAELPDAWIEFLPKKTFDEVGLKTPRVARVEGAISARSRTHDTASRLIGDGEGFGGFQNPIYKNAIEYFFRAGVEAPAEIIVSALREMIETAPKDQSRDVSRYLDGPDLPRIVERARAFVQSVKEESQSEYEYE